MDKRIKNTKKVLEILNPIIKKYVEKNEISIVVVACSDTESVSTSVVIKNGFAALRYLNDGKVIILEDSITTPAITVPPNNARQSPWFNRKLIPWSIWLFP